MRASQHTTELAAGHDDHSQPRPRRLNPWQIQRRARPQALARRARFGPHSCPPSKRVAGTPRPLSPSRAGDRSAPARRGHRPDSPRRRRLLRPQRHHRAHERNGDEGMKRIGGGGRLLRREWERRLGRSRRETDADIEPARLLSGVPGSVVLATGADRLAGWRGQAWASLAAAYPQRVLPVNSARLL